MTETIDHMGAMMIADGDPIAREIAKTGEPFEPATVSCIKRILAKREGAFIDVGAFTGWYSVPIAMMGRTVHAFEPHPKSSARLATNAGMNDAKVTIHRQAASNRNRPMTMHYNGRMSLTSGASLDKRDCLAPSATISVECVKIDAMTLPAPALMKFDVEGHEVPALEGARMMIVHAMPHLVIEANTDLHKRAVCAFLAEVGGYDVEMADGRNIICSPAS